MNDNPGSTAIEPADGAAPPADHPSALQTRPHAPEPWEQQPAESDTAFGCFTIYRDLGARRSLSKACCRFYDNGTANLRQLAWWSSAHSWVERCRAWDHHCDKVRQKALLARHIRSGKVLMDKGLEAILARKPEEITIREAIELVDHGAKLARVGAGIAEPDVKAKARGDAEAAAGQRNNVNVNLGTDALLDAARRLSAERDAKQAKRIEAPHAEPLGATPLPDQPENAP
jgi:hypothetical protein